MIDYYFDAEESNKAQVHIDLYHSFEATDNFAGFIRNISLEIERMYMSVLYMEALHIQRALPNGLNPDDFSTLIRILIANTAVTEDMMNDFIANIQLTQTSEKAKKRKTNDSNASFIAFPKV